MERQPAQIDEEPMTMASENLSFNTRKSLANHLGELAGQELTEFLHHLMARIESVERGKVDVTPIVPAAAAMAPAATTRSAADA
jgi:hypothetical protein